MNQPDKKQIEEAKAYVRSRVEAELSMKSNLHDLLGKAADKVVSIARLYGLTVEGAVTSTNPAVRYRLGQVIDWLMLNIVDYTETLAVGEHKDDKGIILPYIHRKQYGKTFQERLSGYAGDYVLRPDRSDKSSLNSLTLLTTFAVTEGWMRWWGLQGERAGAVGFYSFRGSSYPCSLCDTMVGYHPIGQYVGAWHPHCKCYFVFV